MSSTTMLLKGLSLEEKDFLSMYAKKYLGSPSRTKAILALVRQAMLNEENDENVDIHIESENKKALLKNAKENKEKYIQEHQNKIKKRAEEIDFAKKNKDYNLVKKLQRSSINVDKVRIQISIPIYDYEYLDKLSNLHNSSVNYYVRTIIHNELYNEKKMLGSELEELKKSNFELHKIGVNINQIAKAINAGEHRNLPIEKLSILLKKHIEKVSKVLCENVGIY